MICPKCGSGDDYMGVVCYKCGWERDSDMAGTDMQEFMMVLRQALLMVCRWIEKKYNLHSN
jgi:uncharacterized protein (DUF983 family)